MDIEVIAKVCHAANKALSEAVLADYSHKSWDDSSDHVRGGTINGVLEAIKRPNNTPEGQHLVWVKYKLSSGWTYGESKSEADKTHPCLVTYEELPKAQQDKDKLFLAIVNAFAVL